MKLILFSCSNYDRFYFETAASQQKNISITYCNEKLNPATAVMTAGYDGVICFVNDILNENCLLTLSKNKVQAVFLRCAGYNNVDLEAAKKFNISVYRVPAYSPEAVAEHAVTLMLALNRKIHKAYSRTREMNFSLDGLVGKNISGQTVGVIGLGRIGKSFCKIMSGFGVNILGHDPAPDLKWISENKITLTSKEEILSQSDVISFHCPLNNETHHFLNSDNFLSLKKNCMLVNTSRGALIETTALIDALKKQHIAGAALDVYEFESELFFKDHSAEIIQDDTIARLTSFPNVLITAHQGFLTEQALQQISEITLKNVIDYFQNQSSSKSTNLVY